MGVTPDYQRPVAPAPHWGPLRCAGGSASHRFYLISALLFNHPTDRDVGVLGRVKNMLTQHPKFHCFAKNWWQQKSKRCHQEQPVPCGKVPESGGLVKNTSDFCRPATWQRICFFTPFLSCFWIQGEFCPIFSWGKALKS